MADELMELKSVLRSLVVSSPTQMDLKSLLRDYRNMLGAHLPLAKYGHKNALDFLKERFSDCFVFGGPPSNPVLTLIVPDTLKHIDKFVQKQKVPSTSKCKSKRRSIPESVAHPPRQDLIIRTYRKPVAPIAEQKTVSLIPEQPNKSEVKAPVITNYNKVNISDCQKPPVTSDDVKNFLRKRLPFYNSMHYFEETQSQDDDSGKHTSSSTSSAKALQFEELKAEILELVTEAPKGVWCTDLIKLYRDRYKRELNFSRFGFTSVSGLAAALDQRVHIAQPTDTDDWLLLLPGRAPSPPRPQRRAPARAPARALAGEPDPDDALPGIDFDPDVFPEDCMSFADSIPSLSLAECRPGAMLEVIVGEVYSPSHFWYIRLGEQYNIAMEDMMDDMARYYNGEGKERRLARGAIRVGHYCAALYDGDWHRALIVKILDSDTVKVRHVDYGTVDTVASAELRPLRRGWAGLPAQASRARLAAVRPSAAGRRWPRAAAAHFLGLVSARPLVANVVAVDAEEGVIETLLLDTSGAEDRCVSGELVRAGHADARADSALLTAECYLYPRFEALESGATPNYAEIHAYLRDGIALDYVQAYREHVPLCLPADVPARPPAPPAPAPPASAPTTRIPLLWPAGAPDPTPSLPPSSPPSPPSSPTATSKSSNSRRSSTSPLRSISPCPATSELTPTQPPPGREQPAPPTTQSVRSAQPERQPDPCSVPSAQYGMVTLSPAECLTYSALASVDSAAAHWYMASKLDQARRPPGHPGTPAPFCPRDPQGQWGPAGLAPGHFGPPGCRDSPGHFGPPDWRGPAGHFDPPILPGLPVHMGPPGFQGPLGFFGQPGFQGPPPVQFVSPGFYGPPAPFGPPPGFS